MSGEQIDILVVDDDISHCTILQALLRGWGYRVALAYNGVQALEQVRQTVFDLVLCDIRMAEMDGIETLKEIKTWNPSIPVLIMTAYSSVDTAVEALKSGALDYLIKPLDFDKLQQTLSEALAHTRLSESPVAGINSRRVGHRERAGRAGAARQQRPQPQAAGDPQLCRTQRVVAGVGAVWSRERRLYRRGQTARRAFC